MNTKIMISALAIAMATAGFAPSEVEAKPKYKKAVKKAYKQDRKFHKQMSKHYYRGYYPPVYKYKAPKYERESFGIYTTPTGGLGFHYSEHQSRYRGYPYGGYGYPYYSGYGINIGF